MFLGNNNIYLIPCDYFIRNIWKNISYCGDFVVWKILFLCTQRTRRVILQLFFWQFKNIEKKLNFSSLLSHYSFKREYPINIINLTLICASIFRDFRPHHLDWLNQIWGAGRNYFQMARRNWIRFLNYFPTWTKGKLPPMVWCSELHHYSYGHL